MATRKIEKTKSELKPISFRIASIRTNEFYEKDYTQYGIEEGKIEQGYCNIGFGLKVDAEKGTLTFPIKVDFYVKEDEKASLFGVETAHSFVIKDFKSQISQDKEGKYDIPDYLIERMLGIALSATRGILVASVTIPEYKRILLPLIDTKKLILVMRNNPEFGIAESSKN